MIVDSGVKFALVIVLCFDLSTSKLPALVESIDGVEGAKHRLEVDVYGTIFVLLVELYVLYWPKLCQVGSANARNRMGVRAWEYLAAECLAHVLTDTAIVAVSILFPVDTLNAPPRDYNTRFLAESARFVFLGTLTTPNIPDLLRFDLSASFIVKCVCAWRYLALLDF